MISSQEDASTRFYSKYENKLIWITDNNGDSSSIHFYIIYQLEELKMLSFKDILHTKQQSSCNA